MNKPFRSIPVNMVWTLLGQITYILSQWMIILILTKIQGVEAVGLFTLALSISAPIIMFFNLRMHLVLTSDTKQDNQFIDYFALRLFTTLVSFICIICLVFWAYTNDKFIIIFIGLAKSFEAISDICYALIRKHEYTKYIAVSQISTGLLMLVCFSSTIYFTNSLDSACIAIALSRLLVLIFYDIPIAIKTLSLPHPIRNFYQGLCSLRKRGLRQLKKLIIMGIPLGAVAGLNSLNTNIPKYFVSKLLGNAMLGYFTPMTYIFNISLVIVGLLLTTTIPRLAHYYSSHEHDKLNRLIKYLIFMAFFAGGLGALISHFFGAQIITLLFGPLYSHYAYVLTYLMIAATLNYIAIIFIYLLTAIRALNSQVILFFIAVAITTALSGLLIAHYQLAGAAFVEIITGSWLMLGFSSVFIYKTRQYRQSIKQMEQYSES